MGLVWVALAALALTACSDGGTPLAGSRDLLLQASELREGCVANSLDVLLRTLDRVAPMAEELRTDHLDSLPGGGSCDLYAATGEETEHELLCYWPAPDGGAVTLDLRLTYLDETGSAIAAPTDGGSLRVLIDVRGEPTEALGEISIRVDPARGLVVTGDIGFRFGLTCLVKCEIDEIVAAVVADAPFGTSVLVHTGNLDLEIDRGDGDWRYGSAALVGRTAIVAIAVNGYFSQGEIDLVP
jgi:hypothetical protein